VQALLKHHDWNVFVHAPLTTDTSPLASSMAPAGLFGIIAR
jgi:hypothetical protein